jgi:hypothetical protein
MANEDLSLMGGVSSTSTEIQAKHMNGFDSTAPFESRNVGYGHSTTANDDIAKATMTFVEFVQVGPFVCSSFPEITIGLGFSSVPHSWI